MPATKKSKKKRKASVRKDGRISTVIYIEADLLDRVQAIADTQDRAAWRWIEDAVSAKLAAEKT